MLKKLLLIILLYFFPARPLFSQKLPLEIVNELAAAKNDSALVAAIERAYSFFRERDRDSAIAYIRRGFSLCERNNQFLMKLKFKNFLANQLLGKQQFAPGYALLNETLHDAKEISAKNSTWLFYPDQSLEVNRKSLLSAVHYNLQILMQQTSNWKECKYHLDQTEQLARLLPEAEAKVKVSQVISGRGYAFLRQEKLDSALFILKSGIDDPEFSDTIKPFLFMVLGSVYAEREDYENAKKYLYSSLAKSSSRNTNTRSAYKLSQVYQLTNNIDSGYYFARMLLDILVNFGSANYEVDLGLAYNNLYKCFKLMNKEDSAYKYVQLSQRSSDSLAALRIRNLKEFQQMTFAEQKRLEGIETEQRNKAIRWIAYFSVAFSVLVVAIAVISFKNARQRKKSNKILLEQKQALELTLSRLKSAQAQLIQSEKMASLGELTAGIAHEIQNPLNFVNNFSEVSKELIGELSEEVIKGNYEEVKALAADIIANLEKINHHGKRADGIVKSMLAHSRTSSGITEETDINALCEEYLRLSYHGMRAKDQSLQASFRFVPDNHLPKLNVVPQDIGRVLLNLFNNAFYAVHEKSKIGMAGYKPEVVVTTEKRGNLLEIRVVDNGNGIPEGIREKIFQPFYTTKPTGQGTGLGLSLSYDIVKAHGGEIKMDSDIGKGSFFTITLPLI